MFNYASIAQIATAQLKNFGQLVTLRKTTPSTYVPATGVNTLTAPTDYARNGVLSDFKGATNGPGGQVKLLDKKFLMEAGVVPTLEDRVIIGTDDYGIVGIMETNPAGLPICYTLHLRK